MQDIQKVDKNFMIQTALTRENVTVYDVGRAPFQVFGLILPENDKDRFRRMPEAVAKKVSEGVEALHANTAGGRVCFATDSSCIAIHAEVDKVAKFSHMPLTGSAGFDLYKKVDGVQKYIHSFLPPQNIDTEKQYDSEVIFPEGKMQEYILNFPLYSDVTKLYIILDETAEVKMSGSYTNELPVVYYGSSITQGGCASRPGNSYQNIISRRYNLDYINMGFSGNAKGETAMAEYIASLSMSAFVYDYDHNAPNIEHLKDTHEVFFNIIREKNPELPIICVSRPFCKVQADYERRDLIRTNVERWQAAGDRNVYFLDGDKAGDVFHAGDSIVVDGCHPNDLGFWCMAELIGEQLKKVLEQE